MIEDIKTREHPITCICLLYDFTPSEGTVIFTSLNIASIEISDFLGPVQTPNFSRAESNANELGQKILLICIRFDT